MAAGCTVALLLVLRHLPYSTAELERIEPAAAASAPGADRFVVGDLVWDLAEYRTAPSLEPLRQYVRGTCHGVAGLGAALCLSDAMASQFRHGDPPREPFDAGYEPSSALRLHLGGHPGHCVTRASLIAASLLAAGTPARMLQLIRRDGVGHNVLEVWDGDRWIVFDPSLGVAFARSSDPTDLIGAADIDPDVPVTLVALGRVPVGAAPLRSFYDQGVHSAFAGALLYPEPWTYARVGQASATWPLRARFAITGAVSPSVGPLQTALRLLVVASTAVAFAFGVMGLRRRARAVPAVSRVPRQPSASPGPARPQQAPRIVAHALSREATPSALREPPSAPPPGS